MAVPVMEANKSIPVLSKHTHRRNRTENKLTWEPTTGSKNRLCHRCWVLFVLKMFSYVTLDHRWGNVTQRVIRLTHFASYQVIHLNDMSTFLRFPLIVSGKILTLSEAFHILLLHLQTETQSWQKRFYKKTVCLVLDWLTRFHRQVICIILPISTSPLVAPL